MRVCPSKSLAYELRLQIYGPVLQPLDSIKSLNQSSAELYQFLDGSLETIPDNVVDAWVDVRDVAAASVAAIVRKHSLAELWKLIGNSRNGQRPKDASSSPVVRTIIRRLPAYYVRHSQTVHPRFPQSSLLELQRTGIPWGVFIVLTQPNQRRSCTSSTRASKSPLLTLSRASSRLRRRHDDDSSIATWGVSTIDIMPVFVNISCKHYARILASSIKNHFVEEF